MNGSINCIDIWSSNREYKTENEHLETIVHHFSRKIKHHTAVNSTNQLEQHQFGLDWVFKKS